jgi:DNA-binding CsgD family transcriptional regulator
MLTDVEKARLIGLIYDAASDSRQWFYVLQELQRSFDADATSWGEFDFTHRKGEILDSIGYGQSYLRSYAENYSSLNMWLQERWCIPPGQVLLSEEILSEAELVQTKFYAEWLKPQNLHHRICAVVRQEGQRIFYLEALRSKAKDPYGQQAIQCLSALLPSLQQAMQRNSYFWQLAVIKEVIDRWPQALLVVNRHAKPLIMNRIAEHLVRDETLFLPNLEKLSLTGLKSSVIFHQFIEKAATQSSNNDGNQTNEAMIVPRRLDQPPIWFVVSPLSRKLRKVVCQEEQVALVYVYTPEVLGSLQKEMIKTFFGLTPAEQRLAQLILEGCRLDAAADRLGISRNTARTHMKRIYAKTNTENQSDLVRLILGGPWKQISSKLPILSL